MSSGSDFLIIGIPVVGLGAGIIAYSSNWNGFKDWLDNMFSGGRFPPIIPISEQAEDKALANCPSCPSGKSKMVRSDGKCGCIDVGSNIKPNPNTQSGSSGHCSWDSKGGTCWNNTACTGKPFKVCATYPHGESISISSRCNAIGSLWTQKQPKCNAPAPKPTPTPTPANCPGKSGNCNWDCKNAYCWTSTGPRANKICIHGPADRNKGCSMARSEFLAYNAGTPTKAFRARSLSLAAKAFAGRRIPIRLSTSYHQF